MQRNGPPFKKHGRFVRYRKRDLDAWGQPSDRYYT